MVDGRRRVGPIGWRLLAAFVGVSLISVIVLVALAIAGTQRGLAAEQEAARAAAVEAAVGAAAAAYTSAGGWDGADLTSAESIAADAGARLRVVDADGRVVSGPTMGGGMGAGMGNGGTSANASSGDVVVDGTAVGTVTLMFGTGSAATAQRVAWTWILVAAAVAVGVAVGVAWFVSRRITRPLVRLSSMTRAFAAGDRAVRPSPEDLAGPGELGDLARAFSETADQLASADAARRRMSADLAHELRTPLAVLQAGLEELRDGLVPADAATLTSLHEQSLRLGRVVRDLDELSSAENAALTLHRAPVDLGALVGDAVRAAHGATTASGLVVTTALARGVEVDADPDRLHQVAVNLLANTARHCRPGDHVAVTVSREGQDAVLVVADDGPGITPEDLPHVFDRLWRGRADREADGSGIGLAVVRELVQAHGGAVTAVSDGLSGTTMTVRLPLS